MVDEKEQDIRYNLGFISKAYFSAESAFPYWETVYALIIGQLFITYFQIKGDYQIGLFITFVGIVFSICWFILVSLSRQLSDYRYNVMKILQIELCRKYENRDLEFYSESKIFKEYEEQYQKEIDEFSVTIRKAFSELNPWKARNSTWYYRRLLPLILIYIWFLLLLFECLRLMCHKDLLDYLVIGTFGTVIFIFILLILDP
jgi:hypothetical protein